MKRFALNVMVSAALVSLTAHARADEDPPASAGEAATTAPRRSFGSGGSLVLDDLLGFSASTSGALGAPAVGLQQTGWFRYSDAKADGPNNTSLRSTQLALAPSLDVFVAPRLSVGGQVSVYSSRVRSGMDSTMIGGGLRPRVGWVFAVTEELALWTHAFGYLSAARSIDHQQPDGTSGPGDAKNTSISWGMGVDAMFVARVGRSVALTFGPALSYGKSDLVDSAQSPYPISGSSILSFGARGGIALVL